ncbi:hypothetical protein T484DRAFT_1833893 [Baffinella frigidus]|nr:hypothetical protein T484DRAFT_1833893 [Cryptophyta sp. CCMP2293]
MNMFLRIAMNVLPFLLRRTKADVLDDLPPKIIQDVLCPATHLQLDLYDAFKRRHKTGNALVPSG